MVDPCHDAAALLVNASQLESVREQLQMCIHQLRQEPTLSLWLGHSRREYDAERSEVEVIAAQLEAEIGALVSDQRWRATALVPGGFE